MTKDQAVRDIAISIIRQLGFWGIERFWPGNIKKEDIGPILCEGGEYLEKRINDGLHDGDVPLLYAQFPDAFEEGTALALNEYQGPTGESGIQTFVDMAESRGLKAKSKVQPNIKSN